MPELAILRRFPALEALPRVSLGTFPTPIESLSLHDGRTVLIKRDDRSAALIGGNKVRGLEWLFGGIREGDHVVTVGPRGSTHALITASYARQLGAGVTVVRWNQEMNRAARSVDARLHEAARIIDARWVPTAYAIAAALRLQKRVRWIPAGGASPLAALGHVNAALELVEQCARGECDLPECVVVPLGTGGTAAGLALGFLIAGVAVRLVAVRVVPRIVGRRQRILSLANRAARLIERTTGQRLPRVGPDNVVVAEEFYGGAYGRPIEALADERALDTLGVRLDDTYSRKAFVAAIAQVSRRTLFWLTFDGRILGTRD